MVNKIKHWCWVNKEGFLVGTGLAVLLWYLGWNFLNINTYLNLVIMILVLGGIGAAIDAVIEPNK